MKRTISLRMKISRGNFWIGICSQPAYVCPNDIIKIAE